jgi:hypothetical protein
MKSRILIFALASFVILNSFQCEHDIIIIGNTDVTIKINDDSARKNVGDKITLTSNYNAILPLSNGKDTYDNSNQHIGYVVHLYKLEANNAPTTRGVSSFDIELSTGSIYDIGFLAKSPIARAISFNCSTNCDNEITFTCKEPGYYCIFMPTGSFSDAGEGTIDNIFIDAKNNADILKEINLTQIVSYDNGGGAALSITNFATRSDVFYFQVK